MMDLDNEDYFPPFLFFGYCPGINKNPTVLDVLKVADMTIKLVEEMNR